MAESATLDAPAKQDKAQKAEPEAKLETVEGTRSWVQAQIDKQDKREVFVKLPEYLKNQHQGAQDKGYVFYVTISINGVFFHCVRGETNRVPDEVYRMLLRSGECNPIVHEDQKEMPQLTKHRHSNLHQYNDRPTLDIMPSNSVRPPRSQ